MQNFFNRLLQSFAYGSGMEFCQSLAPSTKYTNMSVTGGVVSSLAVVVAKLFGLDLLAFCFLLLGFAIELFSGLIASVIKKEQISSFRFSRFAIKAVCYLFLIAMPFVFANNFKAQGRDLANTVFDWMYLFFLFQISFELVISITENVAVISGKSKEYWIAKLQDKLVNIFK